MVITLGGGARWILTPSVEVETLHATVQSPDGQDTTLVVEQGDDPGTWTTEFTPPALGRWVLTVTCTDPGKVGAAESVLDVISRRQ